jgi:hypothetical protein
MAAQDPAEFVAVFRAAAAQAAAVARSLQGEVRRRTLEAGGAVLFGDRLWQGEDMLGNAWTGSAHAVAESPRAAAALLQAVG